jgi:DNA replication and repair protein RecF
MQLLELRIERFRNLAPGPYAFGERTNLILGDNGVGKTNLLEAVAMLGNLRSFRGAGARQVVHHGAGSYRLAAEVHVGGRQHRLEQLVEVGPPLRRELAVDGAPVELPHYLRLFPIFAINGPDRELVTGAPEGRRAIVDRLAFLLRTAHLDDLRAYRRALRQRNAALAAGATEPELAAWEGPLAAAAARVVAARREAARRLAASFEPAYRAIAGAEAPELRLEYRGEPWLVPADGAAELEESYRSRYNETRVRDREAGYTVDGPHRHDLGLATAGRGVRHVLSSGQAKAVAAALRLATHAEIEGARGESLPVVVDDVDAELDGATLARLVSHLGDERQLFLSSTRDWVGGREGPGARRFWLERGVCVRREAESDD